METDVRDMEWDAPVARRGGPLTYYSIPNATSIGTFIPVARHSCEKFSKKGGRTMDPRMVAIRKELAKTGSKALVSLNKAMSSVGQDIVRMNTDQCIASAGWLETQKSSEEWDDAIAK